MTDHGSHGYGCKVVAIYSTGAPTKGDRIVRTREISRIWETFPTLHEAIEAAIREITRRSQAFARVDPDPDHPCALDFGFVVCPKDAHGKMLEPIYLVSTTGELVIYHDAGIPARPAWESNPLLAADL